MQEASLDKIREWLVEGLDNPETFVDLRWVILEESRSGDQLVSFRASHPKVPVNMLVLQVRTLEEVPVARLVIETFISTIDLDAKEKLSLYRKLLDLSRLPLVKFYLYGDEDIVGIAVDLDLRSLSKEEFNDALLTLFLAYMYLSSLSKSIDELLKKEEFLVLGLLVKKYLEKTRSKEAVIEYLVKNGIDEKMAREIVEIVDKTVKKEKHSGLFI